MNFTGMEGVQGVMRGAILDSGPRQLDSEQLRVLTIAVEESVLGPVAENFPVAAFEALSDFSGRTVLVRREKCLPSVSLPRLL